MSAPATTAAMTIPVAMKPIATPSSSPSVEVWVAVGLVDADAEGVGVSVGVGVGNGVDVGEGVGVVVGVCVGVGAGTLEGRVSAFSAVKKGMKLTVLRLASSLKSWIVWFILWEPVVPHQL